MFATALLSLLSAALVGCGPRITKANIDIVNKQRDAAEAQGRSLSPKEVESILGPPTRIEPFIIEKPTVRELPGARYIYEQDGKKIELHFVDNKLETRVGQFGEPPPERGERLREAAPAQK